MEINFKACDHQHAEAEWTVEQIEALIADGVSRDDIVVLYRTNRLSRAIEDELIAKKVPYRIIGMWGFWARFYPKLIVSAFMLAGATHYNIPAAALESAIKIAIDSPKRFLGVKTAEKGSYFEPNDPVSGLMRAKLSSRQIPNRDMFVDAIMAAREAIKAGEQNIWSICDKLCEDLGIKQYLRDAPSEDDLTPESNGDGQLPVLGEVLDAMAEYEKDGQAFLDYVIEAMSTMATTADIGMKSDQITLMSIHRSKGLQWRNVFIVGFTEDCLPHKMAVGDAIDEERRIAYVAITRAMDRVYLSTPTTEPANQDERTGASRFLAEMGLYAAEKAITNP